MTTSEEIDSLSQAIDAESAKTSDFLRLALLKLVTRENNQLHIVSLLKTAHEMDPENVDVMFWLAYVIYIYFDDMSESERLLRMALDRNDSRSECLDLLAGCMHMTGRSASEYLPYLSAAVAHEPTWVFPRRDLANALRKVGMWGKAREMESSIYPLLGQYNAIDDPVDKYFERVITGRALSPTEYSSTTGP